MRFSTLMVLFVMAACSNGTTATTKETPPTVDDGDADTDTDADSDADSDTDTDADTDETAHTGTPPTGSGG
ncbi:MAG: hypothetical protein ABMB14_32505 [Myxococcota bacterium]